MKLALLQAQENLGHTSNNPSVGCVITKNNSVISVGCTGNNGRPHAEYNAINQSKINLKGAKLYVTLEPCSHYGITPPCTKSIINNRIKKVFFSINDPDFRSHKKSIKLLEKRNIIVNKGICNNEVNSFYKSYIKSKNSLLPFVTCKLAISKDFFTINKKERWITNKFSRSRVHLMRSNHDCIMTSCETIIKDNPNLTCRINGLSKRSPTRVILDNKLKIPVKSKIFGEKMNMNTIIFYNKVNPKKITALKKLKIRTFRIALNTDNDLDLKSVLINVKKLGFSRIFLESGIKLATNFLKNDLVDDLKIFISNTILGKNGSRSVKDNFMKFIKNKKFIKEKINLFGEKLISYKMR